MPAGPLQTTKRVLVRVLLSLAAAYGVAVDIKRDSEDEAVVRAYRSVSSRVHPDKGGDVGLVTKGANVHPARPLTHRETVRIMVGSHTPATAGNAAPIVRPTLEHAASPDLLVTKAAAARPAGCRAGSWVGGCGV